MDIFERLQELRKQGKTVREIGQTLYAEGYGVEQAEDALRRAGYGVYHNRTNPPELHLYEHVAMPVKDPRTLPSVRWERFSAQK